MYESAYQSKIPIKLSEINLIILINFYIPSQKNPYSQVANKCRGGNKHRGGQKFLKASPKGVKYSSKCFLRFLRHLAPFLDPLKVSNFQLNKFFSPKSISNSVTKKYKTNQRTPIFISYLRVIIKLKNKASLDFINCI